MATINVIMQTVERNKEAGTTMEICHGLAQLERMEQLTQKKCISGTVWYLYFFYLSTWNVLFLNDPHDLCWFIHLVNSSHTCQK